MNTRNLIRAMNALVFCSIAYIVGDVISNAYRGNSFSFSFSWLAFVYFVTALLSLLTLIVLRKHVSKNSTSFWFKIYIVTIIAFMIGSGFETASANLATYTFWFQLLNFPAFLISPLYLVFILAFTDKQDLLYRPITWLIVFGTTFLVLPLTTASKLISDPSKAVLHIYGYSNNAPPVQPALVLR